ncbi:MAG: hypothetical protein LBL57_10565 [Tannerella sp.]|nr:hypothetical protein [Tannerella sp.]
MEIEFRGIDEANGHMFTFLDEATGADNVMTPGNLFHIHGTSLKIAHDSKPEHAAATGL